MKLVRHGDWTWRHGRLGVPRPARALRVTEPRQLLSPYCSCEEPEMAPLGGIWDAIGAVQCAHCGRPPSP